MTLKLKIFKTIKNPNIEKEKDDPRDSYLIDALVQDHVDDSMLSKLEEFFEQQAAPREGNLPHPSITKSNKRERVDLA